MRAEAAAATASDVEIAAAAAVAADEADARQGAAAALPPAFLLVSSRLYLRLYTPEGIRQGAHYSRGRHGVLTPAAGACLVPCCDDSTANGWH